MGIYYDTTSIQSIDDALELYDAKEFRSPMRSTVPLLSWLKHEPAALGAFLKELSMPADSDLCLEYGVTPPNGKGQPSRTDLMIKSNERAVAVEAKWTEPRYETVGEWLKVDGETSDNRVDVLKGWLSLLQPHIATETKKVDVSDVVYQMVHRAASACAAGGPHPAMVYLVFKPSEVANTAATETIAADLQLLRSRLGHPGSFPFYVVEVNLRYTSAFEAIQILDKKDENSAKPIKAALAGPDRLFDFDDYRLIKVANL